jgi:hypothetical protein
LEEGRKHHNLVRVGCKNVFAGSGTTLLHDTFREKVVRNKLANLTFIHNRQLEQMWVRGGHGWEEASLQARNQGERGNEDREEEEEKWRRHEKWLGLTTRFPF